MSPPTTSPCKEKEAITGNVATRGRQSCAPRQTSLPAELGPMLQLVPSHAGASPSAHCTAQHSSCFAQDIFWLKEKCRPDQLECTKSLRRKGEKESLSWCIQNVCRTSARRRETTKSCCQKSKAQEHEAAAAEYVDE